MEEDMKAALLQTFVMVMVFILGQMEQSMMVIIKMI
jgi:hypothetical protein